MTEQRMQIDFAANSSAIAKLWHRKLISEIEREFRSAEARGYHLWNTNPDAIWAEAAKHVYNRRHGRHLSIGFWIDRAAVTLPKDWRKTARQWLIANEAP